MMADQSWVGAVNIVMTAVIRLSTNTIAATVRAALLPRCKPTPTMLVTMPMMMLSHATQATPAMVSFPLDQAKFAARMERVTGFQTRGESTRFPEEVTFAVGSEDDRKHVYELLREDFAGTDMRVRVGVVPPSQL